MGLSYQHEDESYSYWVWVVMPLGIVDAAHIFTTLTDPLIECILLRGKRANIYRDTKVKRKGTLQMIIRTRVPVA